METKSNHENPLTWHKITGNPPKMSNALFCDWFPPNVVLFIISDAYRNYKEQIDAKIKDLSERGYTDFAVSVAS